MSSRTGARTRDLQTSIQTLFWLSYPADTVTLGASAGKLSHRLQIIYRFSPTFPEKYIFIFNILIIIISSSKQQPQYAQKVGNILYLFHHSFRPWTTNTFVSCTISSQWLSDWTKAEHQNFRWNCTYLPAVIAVYTGCLTRICKALLTKQKCKEVNC